MVVVTGEFESPPYVLSGAVLGGIGLFFIFAGCIIPGGSMLGTVLCAIGVILGYTELQKIKRGDASEEGRPLAMIGTILGGGGCLLELLFFALAMVFGVAYVGLILAMIGLEAM